MSQKSGEVNVEQVFVVNVLADSTKFSAKTFRKLFQRQANSVLSLSGKSLGISKGRRFDLSMDFQGLEVSRFTTFYNSGEKSQAKFNRELKLRLQACIVDVKDLMETVSAN